MKYGILIGFIWLCFTGLGQDKKIDQLEVLYDQGHYMKVLRKSSRLLADPIYDYSGLPSFYQSLAMFRLASDENWFDHHPDAIENAVGHYRNFMDNERIGDYIFAHYHEIAKLKTYLGDLESEFKAKRYNNSVDIIRDFRANELKGIKAKPDFKLEIETPEDKPAEVAQQNTGGEKESKNGVFRDKMVVYAKSLIGTKYRWAGTDPKGFDCSGLVSYVYKKYGILIPRTASAQLKEAKKVGLKSTQKADLVFFGSGSNISHVGLVVSEKGKPIIMVHASTSKGVIVTKIEESTYWKPKLKAAGTYI